MLKTMNKERKERLAEVETTIEDAIDQIQYIVDEEQEAIDNLPDSLQDSQRVMSMYDAIDNMEGLITTLEGARSELGDVLVSFDKK